MDARMYPLATYLRELRQDWPMHNIQTALAELDWMPYPTVAVAAVRAATDPAITHPRGIKRFAETEARGPAGATPPSVCRECHYRHDPGRPDEHIRTPAADVARRGAAAVREAIAAARPADPGGQLPLAPEPAEATP
jgi:hypothetical protein